MSGNTYDNTLQALKYWRFRVFLLPLHNQATRRILEGSPHCDIYTEPTPAEQTQMMDGFLRFVEGWLNKIRRPHPHKNWVFSRTLYPLDPPYRNDRILPEIDFNLNTAILIVILSLCNCCKSFLFFFQFIHSCMISFICCFFFFYLLICLPPQHCVEPLYTLCMRELDEALI